MLAIGNPFGLGDTVTCGIVSAKYRQIGFGIEDNFIQTDASINPGNSGGPLLNLSGEVVGINSSFFSQSGGNQGISFAIPSNQAKQLLPQLRKGRVRRSWLGVRVQDITPELKQAFGIDCDGGALVSQVLTDGPGQKAGIRRDDVVIRFDGQEVRNARDLSVSTTAMPIGKKATIDVLRLGKPLHFSITTEERIETKDPAASLHAVSLMGMTLQPISPEVAESVGLTRFTGILVTDVDEDSPAFESGLEPGDVVIEIDREAVYDMETFMKIFNRHNWDRVLLLLIDREGGTIYFTIAQD